MWGLGDKNVWSGANHNGANHKRRQIASLHKRPLKNLHYLFYKWQGRVSYTHHP